MTLKGVDEIEGFGPVPSSERKSTRPRSTSSGGSKKSSSRASMERDIAAVLIQANLMLAPVLKDDVMDDVEILALAKAVDDQAKRSPRFRAAVQRMLTFSGGTGLFTVTLIIVARRAARHGYISPDYDTRLGAYLALTQMTPQQMMDQMQQVVADAMAAEVAAAANGAHGDTSSESGPIPTEEAGP